MRMVDNLLIIYLSTPEVLEDFLMDCWEVSKNSQEVLILLLTFLEKLWAEKQITTENVLSEKQAMRRYFSLIDAMRIFEES